jgi:hypothetical protein
MTLKPNIERRIKNLESEFPMPEEADIRRQREFLSKCTVPELKRLKEIILRTGRDRNKLTAEEAAFLKALEAKYAT